MLARWPIKQRHRIVIVIIALLAVVVVLTSHRERLKEKLQEKIINHIGWTKSEEENGNHPIDILTRNARRTFRELSQNTGQTSLKNAAREYRARRGRHPPPKFDLWYEYAIKKSAVIKEEFFDQIYHDLGPFWAIPPAQMRSDALAWREVISIRDGNATIRHRSPNTSIWLYSWRLFIDDAIHFLPDVDLAMNENDESVCFVPWEDIDDLMKIALTTKSTDIKSANGETLLNTYQKLPRVDHIQLPKLVPEEFIRDEPVWEQLRMTCPPDSPARRTNIAPNADYSRPPAFKTPEHPFVTNLTMSQSLCYNPELAQLHGALFAPRRVLTTKRLYPLFSGCKMHGNNDILLPAAMYRSTAAKFTGNAEDTNPLEEEAKSEYDPLRWEDKQKKFFWRGTASGGASNARNWRYLHRHRLVSMLNGTQVGLTQLARNGQAPEDLDSKSFPFPDPNLYPLTVLQKENPAIGEWLEPLGDAAFTHLVCEPWETTQWGPGDDCPYLNDYFHTASSVPLAEQYAYKYLPDADGYSFSARYRGLLRSRSLPIKATIYQEYHDVRLIPWYHFIPMQNTFVDWFGILEWLVGYKDPATNDKLETELVLNRKGHDAAAKKIAQNGHDWTAKVLRREDMSVYMVRLFLEYARVSNDERERLAYVDDLLH